MVDIIAKYAFWILICIPIIVVGIVFSIKLTKYDRFLNAELDEKKKEKEQAASKRQEFEMSYKKSHPADKKI